MWDKNLDEGIFLCDHNPHFLTAEFLESLSYVEIQLRNDSWKIPNQLLYNKTDLVAKILIEHSTELRELISCVIIPLSDKRNNDIFQSTLSSRTNYYSDQLFIYKLFDLKASGESECARCCENLYVWETKCANCEYWSEEELDKTTPKISTVNCSHCEGFSFTYRGRRITKYCEYNIESGKRHEDECRECKIHFDYIEEVIGKKEKSQ